MPARDPHTLSAVDVAAWTGAPGLRAIIDVRERGEYILGHIPGSTNISRGLLEIRLPDLIPLKSVSILLYCDDTYRSCRAAATARALGYTDVQVLQGGLDGWAAEGRDVSYGVNVIGKDYGERVAVERKVPQITPEELEDLRAKQNVLVLDVRTPHEFDHEGHLEGAHNVPGGELPATALSLTTGPTPPDAIVLNCAGRTRSIVAADMLASLGVENVRALKNGTMAWLMAGLELETGPDANPLPGPTGPAGRRASELAGKLALDQGVAALDAASLKDALDQGEFMYLLDVRLPAEFDEEHIKGAVSCPMGQLTNYLDDKIHVRQAPIICYSNGHTRAALAAKTLTGIGYPNVRWLDGGLKAWRTSGPTTFAPQISPTLPAETGWEPGAGTITAGALAGLQDHRGCTVIDVRQSSDFMYGHVPSSTWIPRGDLERRIGHVAAPEEDLVIVSDDHRLAGLTATTLEDMGYSSVRILLGGVSAWNQAGHALVEGADGSDINVLAAREEADLVGFGPQELRRTHEDMVRYLEWEERLGDKYNPVAP